MNLVGSGSIVTGVLPDVFPVIDVEDLQTDAWRLADWRICMGFGTRDPAAGLTAEIALENITTTGSLAVVEQIIITTEAISTVGFGVNTAGSALAGVPTDLTSFRDRREPVSPPLPILEVTTGDAIAASIVGRWIQLADDPFTFTVPTGVGVLQPGSLFLIQATTPDVKLHVTYFWRERPIDPAENNF